MTILSTRAQKRFPLLPPSEKQSQFIRIRNVFNSGTAQISPEDLPGLVIDSIRIEGNAYASWPPASRTQLLGRSTAEREQLEHFMKRRTDVRQQR